ncbi:MAG: HPr kinase [Fibrobacteres bacterium]|nr:HPr kinase [Fibrobacterota bacterium]
MDEKESGSMVDEAKDGSAPEKGIASQAPDGRPVSAGYILKVLGGRHAGAEMHLAPGRYSLGQDEECDFIFLDDAFLGGRAVIDVTGPVPLLETTGAVKASVDGSPMAAPAQTLDLYQPVEVGSTRFAIGHADRPWPEPPAPISEPEPSAAIGTLEDPAASRVRPLGAWKRMRVPVLAAALLLALGAGAWYAWQHLRRAVDPAQALRGILTELNLAEISVAPVEGGYLLKGFLETEAQREALLGRVKGFTPPVKTRIVSAEETRASIQGVLDLYQLELPVEVGPMGKAVITGICDNPRQIKELTEAVRQGVQSETEVEEHFHATGTVIPFVTRMLAAKVLDHKIRLEVNRGRLTGVLVKNQMDNAEMYAWNTVRATFRSQFGMDLEERWTDRLSPALMRLNAASRELDSQLVGVTVGELSYITLRNRRKFFEGAKLASGLTVKSIQKDRIVLTLGNVEQNYFLKKGSP